MNRHYVLYGLTKDGRKHATPWTVSNHLAKALGNTASDEVVTKHILKKMNAKQYSDYKLVKYDSASGADAAIDKFLDR